MLCLLEHFTELHVWNKYENITLDAQKDRLEGRSD